MANPRRPVHELRRDFRLERTASARADRLKSLFQPGARARLDLIARVLLAHLASASEKVDVYALAQQEVRSKFAQLSSEQFDLFSFYVLAEVARTLMDRDKSKETLDGMNEMSDSLRLQMMMDWRAKMMSALSNMLKKISATQDDVIQNIK